jgi:hypothetical protein
MSFVGTFYPVSTRSDWVQAFRVRARDTGDLIDLTGCLIKIYLYDYDDDCRSSPRLTAGTDTGEITIPDTGVFIVSYLASNSTAFSSLRTNNYRIVAVLSRDGMTRELLSGIFPVTGTR